MRVTRRSVQSQLRVAAVKGALDRALADQIKREPDLTDEEIVVALLEVAGQSAETIRRRVAEKGTGGA